MHAVEIRTTTGSPREVAAAEQLGRLLQQHDVAIWRFTDLVRIESMVVPRSHPVLRLNTRHLAEDDRALSTYLHEQLHWWLVGHAGADAALEEVRARWPEPPAAADGGAANPFSTWLHLVLCPLEVAAFEQVLGRPFPEEERPPYAWIYRQIRTNRDWFNALVARHALAPPDVVPESIRWAPAAVLPDGTALFSNAPAADGPLLDVLTTLHREHPRLVCGEREVCVDSAGSTRLHPSLCVGGELLGDPAGFALTYAFAQGAVWTDSAAGRPVVEQVPEEVLAAVSADPFPASTAVAGALALRALPELDRSVLTRLPVGQRLLPLLSHLRTLDELLSGALDES